MAPRTLRKLSDRELKAVELLLTHKARHTKRLLRDHSLKQGGKKDDLQKRLVQAMREGRIDEEDVLRTLNEVESWGNQHVFLYNVPAGICQDWKSIDKVRSALRAAGVEDRLDARPENLLPDNWELDCVDWTAKRVRMTWVGSRKWEQRNPDKDEVNGAQILRCFEKRVERAVTSFDWDLDTGDAMMMIQQLPSGDDYSHEHSALRARISEIVDASAFKLVDVGKAINKLEKCGECRNRQVSVKTIIGNGVKYTSSSRKHDVFKSDPKVKASRTSLGDDVVGSLGNFYWEEKGGTQLERDLHTTVIAKDNRIGIFGERTEVEVRYVIGRIRNHCN